MNIFGPFNWATGTLIWWQPLVCLLTITLFSVVFGLIYIYSERSSKKEYHRSTAITFTLLPIIICALVIGVSIFGQKISGTIVLEGVTALLAASLLLHFRSTEMKPEELAFMMFLMGVGFLCGIGFLYFSIIVYVLIVLVYFITNRLYYKKDRK